MSSLKNIVWVGTGKVGLPLLEKVIATGNYNIRLLLRNPLSTYSGLPQGLSSIHQVDYTDQKSLADYLRGQDAVIVFTSFLPGNGLDTKHIALVNAAIDAGVKYFIPSEWALDTAGIMGSTVDRHGPTLPTDIVLAPKRVSHNYLLCRAAEGKIRFAVVYPGVIFENGFKTGILGFDFAARTAMLPDNGINPFPASTLSTISKVIISLFANPSLISNRFYHVADGVLTQQEILQVIEKESGASWMRNSYSTQTVRSNAVENIAKGVYGRKEFVESLMTPFFGGLQVFTKVDNEKLGITYGEVDLREEVARVVRPQLQ
ncbi:isoflavone reductase family protein [Aaosphaeria arxii CBS 175.79]|uniref:Isoflavone reductase family protein n=1 Tax=Aaosphaeria arxii CBS 175.79 TaxID=1450172 RepID=A0A6A5Y3G7_9PLEO|nr:isoflavone reductase family protein [Aaosphaeria arxii CBS 175.79]KAF2019806.1 isoflavone reductase family protein [Aaosphaeria arxii CBS 175.79]